MKNNIVMQYVASKVHTRFLALVIGTIIAISGGAECNARAMTAEDLNNDANQALEMLTKSNPLAADAAKRHGGYRQVRNHMDMQCSL